MQNQLPRNPRQLILTGKIIQQTWAKKLDVFLELNEETILNGKGIVSAEIAKAFAESEFEFCIALKKA